MTEHDESRVPVIPREDTPREVQATTQAYVAVSPCGCVTLARAVTRNGLSHLNAAGRRIERVGKGEADRLLARGCNHREEKVA